MPECRVEDMCPAAVHSCGAEARVEAFELARHQWPSVRLTFEQFSRHLDDLGHGDSLPRHVGALYLCAACTLGIGAACKALDKTYFPALRSAIAAHGQASDFVDDVLQQVRERLLGGPKPRIGSYRGSGSLPGWLRMVACNLAMDNRRTHRHAQQALRAAWLTCAEHDIEEQTCGETPVASPRTAETIMALESLLHESVAWLPAEDRQILSLFYFHDLRAHEIVERTHFDRSTIYRQLHRAEQRLAQRVMKLVRCRWRMAEHEECIALLRELSGLVDLQAAFREQAMNAVAAE